MERVVSALADRRSHTAVREDGSVPNGPTASRLSQQSVRSERADSVRHSLEGRLTDRQREVLRMAYLSGYFESPRRSTGQEVTESLGISHPTFAQHLRAAQRKLCDSLFE
ncbi:helix-turn-helix domain-containing protein [Natronococcus sp. A-GB7]|uniref:helix-turn-helix domain-containing protein n=1 Tax=Natronococcus sp. A-GB7 TaxID=3037649 RepID=UPI00241E3FB0|nr:helix-turn-helix domain-containing protein [Natronococcus sp. A-GB7]MDG5820643.1 helix-turn-helix domain-containing protein [Natronococcus sp. A-GB7]